MSCNRSPKSTLLSTSSTKVERLRTAAEFLDPLGKELVDLAGKNALDNRKRGVVGDTAAPG